MKSTTKTDPRQAAEFINCQRVPGGYILADLFNGNTLATLVVDEGANDVLNSMLRDAVMKVYHEYGKHLGYYR